MNRTLFATKTHKKLRHFNISILCLSAVFIVVVLPEYLVELSTPEIIFVVLTNSLLSDENNVFVPCFCTSYFKQKEIENKHNMQTISLLLQKTKGPSYFYD